MSDKTPVNLGWAGFRHSSEYLLVFHSCIWPSTRPIFEFWISCLAFILTLIAYAISGSIIFMEYLGLYISWDKQHLPL